MAAPAIAVACVTALLAMHLVADARGARVPRAIGKVGASAGLVALALALGVDGAFDRAILAGLALSAVGDSLLLSSRRPVFLGALAAFLLVHAVYGFAFWTVSRPSAWTALLLLVAAAAAIRWLWAHVGDMRVPVVAYSVTVSAMLWLALGVDRPEVRAGALLFYVSDLLVARDRFVRPGIANRAVGLPLYYAGQLLLAIAVG